MSPTACPNRLNHLSTDGFLQLKKPPTCENDFTSPSFDFFSRTTEYAEIEFLFKLPLCVLSVSAVNHLKPSGSSW